MIVSTTTPSFLGIWRIVHLSPRYLNKILRVTNPANRHAVKISVDFFVTQFLTVDLV